MWTALIPIGKIAGQVNNRQEKAVDSMHTSTEEEIEAQV